MSRVSDGVVSLHLINILSVPERPYSPSSCCPQPASRLGSPVARLSACLDYLSRPFLKLGIVIRHPQCPSFDPLGLPPASPSVRLGERCQTSGETGTSNSPCLSALRVRFRALRRSWCSWATFAVRGSSWFEIKRRGDASAH